MTTYPSNVRWLPYSRKGPRFRIQWSTWCWLATYSAGVASASVGVYALTQILF